jgi:hypothetical protein
MNKMLDKQDLKNYIESNEIINNELLKMYEIAKKNEDNTILNFILTISSSLNPLLEEITIRIDRL